MQIFNEKIKAIATSEEPLLFLRPEGFGKSHFALALESFFASQKTPVLSLNFGSRRYKTKSDLDCVVLSALQAWESVWHVEKSDLSEGERLCKIISSAKSASGKKVAIIIDDYDFPIVEGEADSETLSYYTSVLSSLFGALKIKRESVEFSLLLGISRQESILRFAEVKDKTYDAAFSSAAGFFAEDVASAFSQKGEGTLFENEMRRWYGGYYFGGEKESFCAKSVFRALETGSAGSYFPSARMAQMTVEKARLSLFDISLFLQKNGIEATDESFFALRNDETSPIPMMLCAGFLEKKARDKTLGTFSLAFPNRASRAVFFAETARRLTAIPSLQTRIWAIDALRALEKDDLRSFFVAVNSALRGVIASNLRDALTTLFGLLSVCTDCFFEDGYFTVETNSFLHVFAFDLKSMQVAFERLYTKTFSAGKKIVRKTGVLISAESGVSGFRTM